MATLREEKKMKKYLARALLIFAAPTIAATYFPTGDWVSMDGNKELSIHADGEYEVRKAWKSGTQSGTHTSNGQALSGYGCTHGKEKREGNLWVITDSGRGVCYRSTLTGGKLVENW